MKKLTLLSFFIAYTSFCFAQDTIGLKLPMKDNKIIYEGVVECPGKSKTDLYNNARQWLFDYFKSAKYVIQNEDKDLGRIVGKGIILIPWETTSDDGNYDCNLTILIDYRENKYRYRLYDIILHTELVSGTGDHTPYQFTPEEMADKLTNDTKIHIAKKQCRNLLETINIKAHETIESLNKAMVAKTGYFLEKFR